MKYDLTEILYELNCWCMKWKGNINATYNNNLTLVEQVEQLFTVVHEVTQAQITVTEEFEKLYNFVNDYFNNLDEEIKQKIIEIVTSNEYFLDVILPKVEDLIDSNLIDYVSRIMKFVFFGLDDSGHFIAWIPESWSDITFDTNMECGSENYGHLLLSY